MGKAGWSAKRKIEGGGRINTQLRNSNHVYISIPCNINISLQNCWSVLHYILITASMQLVFHMQNHNIYHIEHKVRKLTMQQTNNRPHIYPKVNI